MATPHESSETTDDCSRQAVHEPTISTTQAELLADAVAPEQSLVVNHEDQIAQEVISQTSVLSIRIQQASSRIQQTSSAIEKLYKPVVQGVWKLVWNWMTPPVASSCATGSVALFALAQLIYPPPEVDCEALNQRVSDRVTLSCLQTAIAKGDSEAVLKALNWIGGWEANHPLQNEVQDLLETWSAKVLQAARQHRTAGRPAEAIRLLRYIPHSSPRYTDAWALLQQLRRERDQLEQAIYKDAQVALQQQDWIQASRELWRLQALETEASPTGSAHALTRQIEAEKQAQSLLNQAIQKHSLGEPQYQSEAIAIASQINPNTYVWRSAQSLLDDWSDGLLPVGLQQLEQGNLKEAIVIFRQIARYPNRQAIAQDWLILAQARYLAQTSLEASSSTDLDLALQVGLSPAILTAQSIQPESPRHPQASAHAQQWEQQLVSLQTSAQTLDSTNATLWPETQYQPTFVNMQSRSNRP
ncbi:MAG: hypothetical protein F6K42_20485 [Leptolyngbya sp. SIO1D8]|nr:hypothetical protein [Leptolyngbya sp. SIO1D8]